MSATESHISDRCCLKLCSKTDSGIEKREWKHKHCEYRFWQAKNKGGKETWYTSVFGRKLAVVAKGAQRVFLGKHKWIKRAAYVLAMRSRNDSISLPRTGMKFFPFEEDIMHQIDEALVLCSTGIGMSFFSNPFVRDWLCRLEPRHRPIYRIKLTRVIRCIQDVLQSEVSAMCSYVSCRQCCLLKLLTFVSVQHHIRSTLL